MTTFQTFLELIRAIAVHDDVSAARLCEDPKWAALDLFRSLAKCPIDILLKIDILQTLAVIDAAKQKAKNLDRFPVEVLLEIFANVDDADLLCLADTCRRFEPIAETAFRDRYGDSYYVIDGEECTHSRDMYSAQLNRFGKDVNAIQVSDAVGIDANHWVAKILQEHINRIQKLEFYYCEFKSNDFLSQPMENLVDLSLTYVNSQSKNKQILLKIDLPKCTKLKNLEIVPSEHFTYDSLVRIINENPPLENLTWQRWKYDRNVIVICDKFYWRLAKEVLTPFIIN